MICYFIEQQTPQGPWKSIVHNSPDARHIRQTIRAGWLHGQPRRAVSESGAVLFAMDAYGKVTQDTL